MRRPVTPKRSLQGLASLFILLLACAIRLYRLDLQSIWWDEGHSILMASAPISQIATLPGMDVHPPGFFMVLHVWLDLAGRSKFALRYLSVLFSLLTIALLIRFGRRLKGGGIGIWAGLLMALSPFYVAYAQEVRMYAMSAFFALGSVYFLWRLLFIPKRSQVNDRPSGVFNPYLDKGDWAAYILFTTASLYTHYFTLFLLCFENLLWLAWFAGGRRINQSGRKSFDLLKWVRWVKWVRWARWVKWTRWLKPLNPRFLRKSATTRPH